MLTPIVLALVADHQPIGIAAVAEALRSTTGWNVTERGLYRTLKRLEDSQLLATSQVDAPRTGAKRKELSLTDLGVAFLAGIRANLVEEIGRASCRARVESAGGAVAWRRKDMTGKGARHAR